MEHVTIISQEAIAQVNEWPTYVICALILLSCITAMCILFRNQDLAIKIIEYSFYIGMICTVLSTLICNIFFRVETGRYKYEGYLDKDMTIVEFEEFKQQYSNVRFEDGVWKWEDKE